MNYSAPMSQRPWSPPTTGKPASRTAVAPTTLEQSARDYRELLTAVSTRRQILAGKESASLAFQVVEGKVMRVAVLTKAYPVFYTWHNRSVEHTAPEMTFSVGFATEAELIAARSMVPAAQAGQIDVLLKLVRDGAQPPAPIRVEITNANQLAPQTKVAAIKRGEDGKATGFVVESIPDPS